MMARAEKAEEEYETLRSQFEYIDRRRKDRLDKIIRNDT